jgi:glycosyltransferase involved in cell wall biosynthesis
MVYLTAPRSAMGKRTIFLFDSARVLDELQGGLATAFAGASFLCTERQSDLQVRSLTTAADHSDAGAILVVIAGTDAPHLEELREFVAQSEECFDEHERIVITLPVYVSKAAGFKEDFESALPRRRVFSSHFTNECVFAVKGSVLSLLPPPATVLRDVSWARFAREVNPYGFSVARLPTPIQNPVLVKTRPLALPDLACFFALSREPFERAIAIDLSGLPTSPSGSTEYSLHVSRALVRITVDGLKWVIIADRAVRDAYRLDDWGVEVMEPAAIDRLFDLVFVTRHLWRRDRLAFISAISLRYAVCVLDVIGLRCEYIREETPEVWATSSVAGQHANAIISLSRSDADDVRSYFEGEGLSVPVHAVLITKDVNVGPAGDGPPYALVVGNAFRHKAIDLFLQNVISDPLGIRLAVVADEAIASRYHAVQNLEVLVSGTIPEAKIEALYDEAAVIVFPSVYEGFGLPVVGGLLRGKPVLAIDSSVNRELKQAFDAHNRLELFASHSTLADALRVMRLGEVHQVVPDAGRVRTWAHVAEETAVILRAAAAQPLAWPTIAERTRDVRRVVEAGRPAVRRTPLFRQVGRLVVERVKSVLREQGERVTRPKWWRLDSRAGV